MIKDLFRIDGQAALVTGGGRGLGQAMALALAQAGANIVVVARRKGDLDETVRIIENTGRRAYAVPGDVTDPVLASHAVETCVREFGRLDVLVNNAGAYAMGPLEDTTDETWEHVIDVNLKGTFHFCKAAAKVLKSQGSGKVINVSSILGLKGVAGATAYCAAKAGVILFTRALAAEWAPAGVNVNAIAPGLFDTDMSRAVFEDDTFYQQVLAGIPRGVHGNPEDLAGTVVYLASKASDHLIGQTIHIDGGSSIT